MKENIAKFIEDNFIIDGDLIWFDNDVEIFIDRKDTYYELQVNALNTIYEAFYI